MKIPTIEEFAKTFKSKERGAFMQEADLVISYDYHVKGLFFQDMIDNPDGEAAKEFDASGMSIGEFLFKDLQAFADKFKEIE